MMTFSNPLASKTRIPAEDGPDIAADVYDEGSREWNLRYGSAILGERVLMRVVKIVIPCLCAVLCISLLGNIILASHTDVRVFAVPVNAKGIQAGTVVPVTTAITASDAEKQDILSNWTVDAFSVSPDSIVEKRYLDFVRTHSTEAAYTTLSEYYKTPAGDGSLSPFIRSKSMTVEVQIVRIDTLSPESYQVTWNEIERGFDGHEINRKQVVGTFGVATVQNNPTFITSNAFGVDVTRFSLSHDLGATP